MVCPGTIVISLDNKGDVFAFPFNILLSRGVFFL